MHLIISIALGIVLGVIILVFLPDLFVIGLILLGLALLALAAVLIWHYPILLAFIAVPVTIIGIQFGFSYLWRKLSVPVQRRVRLVGWGAPAASMTALWIWMFYEFASGQMKASRSEGWFVVLLFAALAFYPWFAFYRTWKRPANNVQTKAGVK